jgi:hypothetical protein
MLRFIVPRSLAFLIRLSGIRLSVSSYYKLHSNMRRLNSKVKYLMSKTYFGLDGFQRSQSEDQRISKNIDSIFKTPTGKEVLKYLRSITIESVQGPNASDAELRHLEGQRYLVGVVERRISHAQRIKQNG